VIKHIADHGHASTHPLTGAAQLWTIKLGHATSTIIYGDEHVDYCIVTQIVATGDVTDEVHPGGGKFLH
jgi:hypothetical protein